MIAMQMQYIDDEDGIGPEKGRSERFELPDQVKSDEPVDEEKWSNWRLTVRKCIVEFIGVCFLVYIGSMSFVLPTTEIGPIGAAFAHGFTIAICIMSMGHISGGHFNPAVTLGVTVSGAMHPILALFYMLAQLCGGFFGALFIRASLSDQTYMSPVQGGTNNINTLTSSAGQAIIAEIMATFLLVNSVLCSAVDSGGANVLAPLAIGFTVFVDILAIGMVSGASMNPARSFGPAVGYSLFNVNINGSTAISPSDVWSSHYVHWIGPLLGGLIAGLIYRSLLAKKPTRWFL